jgi:hypothetical protein
MGGLISERQRPGQAPGFPKMGHPVLPCYEIARLFAVGNAAVMPQRAFKLIKLKKTPAGAARAFPSEINTAEAAIAFVESLDPETRAKLHWRVAASALNGLAAGQGSFDQAGRAMRHALAQEGWLVD